MGDGRLNLKTGLLDGAFYQASPNCNTRPFGMVIDLIVLHNISLPPRDFNLEFNHVRDFFLNQLDHRLHPYFEILLGLQVSSHFYIRRDGELWQFVPTHQRAWHAGESQFQDRAGCNDYSIGIELEGVDDIPYTQTQYRVLIDLVNRLQEAYPQISRDRIVGHAEIAPHRKTDPGPAFDWDYFYEKLYLC